MDSVLAKRKPFKIGVKASENDIHKCNRIRSIEWPMLVHMSDLNPGGGPKRHHYISLANKTETYTHIRLNLHPDGGIARLKVYGEIKIVSSPRNFGVHLDMIAATNGGRCLMYSNAHYGHPKNIIKPGRGAGMADGW